MDYVSSRLPHDVTLLPLHKARAYLALTKPGIIMGNAVTMIAGFALASQSHYPALLFLATLSGLCLVIAAAGVFNNYFDRAIDARMERTKKRPLAHGALPIPAALLFGTLLGCGGLAILSIWTNPLTTALALLGFMSYVFAYGFLKYHTIHGTLIGSFPGAIPPLVGYCAVSGALDSAASLLFLSVVCWQMPHFYAIAIRRLEDYRAAGIPVLPLHAGIHATQNHMLAYTAAFLLCCLLLVANGSLGILFALVTTILALIWFGMSLRGWQQGIPDPRRWAYESFLFSLIVILGLCLAIHLDLLLTAKALF